MHPPEKYLFPEQKDNALFRFEHHREYKETVFYHFHPQFELNLTETARARRYVGDSVEEISGQDLILISPNLPHRWEIGAAGKAEFWVLVFSRESLGIDLLSRSEMAVLTQFLNRASRGFRFSRNALQQAADKIKTTGEVRGITRVTRFLEILAILIDDAGKEPVISGEYASSGSEENYRLLARIVEAFSPLNPDNQGAAPSLNRAADYAGMSVSTFTRFFKRMTGQSFISYMIDLQIHYARGLLKSTDYSVTEISQRSGFSNLSHFNRQFLKATGLQPREYRKQ
ncbi:MAG: AraC family transcriptional regulator [Spirochaetia bacterium]